MDNRWLLKYSKNRFSQRGEDGILEKIFEVLGIERGWCVDVGAYGKSLSNTYALVEKGWHGVLIEANEGRLLKLKAQHERAHRDAICICAFVVPSGEKSLDNLLKGHPLPKDFEFLSIDIDGNDYYIWESLQSYSPLVVTIEFNSLVKYTDYLQPLNGGYSGASLSYMVRLGKKKGYELLSATSFNAFFVKKELFSKFGIYNNSIKKIWTPDPQDFLQMPKPTKIVGFQSGRDVAYCVLENGIPVLTKELERITRMKMELGDGLKFFFSQNENPDDVNCFTSGNWGGRLEKGRGIAGDKKAEERMFSIIAPFLGQYYEFGHHLCHAANAFYTTNFDKALIVTMDGGGREDDKTITGFTISEGTENKIVRHFIFQGSEANLELIRRIIAKYIGRHTNLCVSGGVSLNRVMPGKVSEWFPQIKNIFVDPVPYDTGLAIGSARYLWHQILENPRIEKNIQVYNM